jgi:hypothetical protein
MEKKKNKDLEYWKSKKKEEIKEMEIRAAKKWLSLKDKDKDKKK